MDKEQKAIERIKMASEMSLQYYKKPLLVADSGGKDSLAVLELVKRSGVPFEVMHSHTTADAPQTVYYIRQKFKQLEGQGIKCTIIYPKLSMWQLIVEVMLPPTRTRRYCCRTLKEDSGAGRMITTGVRWSESTKRKGRNEIEALGAKAKNRISISTEEEKQLILPELIILNNDNSRKRRLIEKCKMQAKTVCNPIIDWTDSEVWGFIRGEKLGYNPMYDMGFRRVGCIGCPLGGKTRYQQFRVFPKYKQMYMRAFERMLEARKRKGKKILWLTADEVYKQWMEEDPNQLGLPELDGLEEKWKWAGNIARNGIRQ